MAVSFGFSNVFKECSSQSKFAADGKYLAVPHGCKVTVYKPSITFQEIAAFENADAVDSLQWSPDSTLLMCVVLKRKIVQVWSPEDLQWRCKITEGPLGLTSAYWSPDSRHILAISDFQMRITVWSLASKSVSYLRFAKPHIPCLSFSASGKFLAVAERRDSKDHISIVSCATWNLLETFRVSTEDLAGMAWSPSSDILCIWEAAVVGFKLLVYDHSGRMLVSYHVDSEIIGIKSVLWHPTGQLLLAEGHGDKLLLLNTLTWNSLFEWSVPHIIADANTVVYKQLPRSKAHGDKITDPGTEYDIVDQRPYSIKNEIRNTEIAQKLSHPTCVRCSGTGRYIACSTGEFPSIVFILEVAKMKNAAVVINSNAVTSIAWASQADYLIICTSTKQLHMWSPMRCMTLSVPSKVPFPVKSCSWSPNGKNFVLHSQEMGILCSLK